MSSYEAGLAGDADVEHEFDICLIISKFINSQVFLHTKCVIGCWFLVAG
jgi:hypothetical protein